MKIGFWALEWWKIIMIDFKKIMKITFVLMLSGNANAWRLDTYDSRKGLDVVSNIATPQECETMAKTKWDEYKTMYSSWERDHMQFSTKCTAVTGGNCYQWVIKCPNIVCTTDKIEGRC